MVGKERALVESELESPGLFVMAERFISQKKFKKLLRDLQTNHVESQNIDGKATLNLKELGDRATLIRHVSAIANTGQEGYLIIGVEDKTWKPVGLPADSSLVNSDETQKQINQILSGRIDPSVSVSYRTYPYENVLIGVVLILSGNPPYVISIPDDRYGGQKSDSNKESYVYKGVVYIRRGSESVMANRQSELFAILEARKNIAGAIGSLALIAFVVSIGVGVGVSLTKFPDIIVPTILGGVWGLLVGVLLSNRVTDSMGRYPKSMLIRILRSSLSPLVGIIVGAWQTYSLERVVLSEKFQGFDPLSMGLFFSPFVLILNFLPAVLVFIAVIFGDWIGRVINRSRKP